MKIGSSLGASEGGSGPETIAMMTEAGLDLVYGQAQWSTLETPPAPPDFDTAFSTLIHVYEQYPQFDCLIAVIKPIDTNIRTLPADIAGKPFSDPEVLMRFDRVVDDLAAHPLAEKLSYLFIGNEVDQYLAKNSGEFPAWKGFLGRAVDRVREKMPHLQAGTIHTFQGIRDNPWTFDPLVEVVDVLGVTYYPWGPNVSMRPVLETIGDLRFLQLVAAVAQKPLIFTEIGYASSPVSLSSEWEQALFVLRTFFTLKNPVSLEVVPEALHWMMTFDPPEGFTEAYAEEQGVSSPEFVAMMDSLGLIERDGTEKYGWKIFENLVE
jgi:hypothetical protein